MLVMIYKISAIGIIIMWILFVGYQISYQKKIENNGGIKSEEKEKNSCIDIILAIMKILFTILCPIINTILFIVFLFGSDYIKEQIEDMVDEEY